MDASQYPVAARAGFGNKRSDSDMVSDSLQHFNFTSWQFLHLKHLKAVILKRQQSAAGSSLITRQSVQAVMCHLCLPNRDGIRTNLKKFVLISFRQTGHLIKRMLHKASRDCGRIQKAVLS